MTPFLYIFQRHLHAALLAVERPANHRCTPLRRLSDGRLFPSMSSVIGKRDERAYHREYRRLTVAMKAGKPYRGEMYEVVTHEAYEAGVHQHERSSDDVTT